MKTLLSIIAEMILSELPVSILSHSWVLVLFVSLFAVLLPFVRLIPRNERRVYVNQWTGRFVTRDSYWNLVLPHLQPVVNHHFESFNEFPAPFARPFTLDPPQVELRTRDGVTATIDVHVELVVIDYNGDDIEKAGNESFERRAKERINAWLTQKVSLMSSAELRDYASVQRVLNEPQSVTELNKELKPFLFKVNRVFIDFGGIKFSKDYLNTIGEKIKLEGHAALQEMEAKTKLKQAQTAAEVLKVQSEAENRMKEARIESAAKMYSTLTSNGMLPEHAVKVLMTDRMAEALEKSSASQTLLLSPNSFGMSDASLHEI